MKIALIYLHSLFAYLTEKHVSYGIIVAILDRDLMLKEASSISQPSVQNTPARLRIRQTTWTKIAIQGAGSRSFVSVNGHRKAKITEDSRPCEASPDDNTAIEEELLEVLEVIT